MKYVFDLESNGLYNDVSTVHCIVLKDIDSNKIIQVDVKEALKLLSKAELIIGHNIIKYDIPVLKKLYGFETKAKVFDTLVATRLIWSDLTDSDMKRVHTINYPRSLVNRHSLKAWGIRLGNYKQQIDTDWSVFTQEMLEYCIQDVEVTHTLYQKILGQKIFSESLELEHAVAQIISRQEIYGVLFDKEKATKLYAELSSERDTIKQEMEETFKPITIKRVSEKTGKPLKDKVVEFNPSSRRQKPNR